MGGFIGGVVRTDKRLNPEEFDSIARSIQRRGPGYAFRKTIHPDDKGATANNNSILYLASAQETGFTENGALEGEPPIPHAFTLIDGFPADRSISEFNTLTASQRTVLPNGSSDFVCRLIEDDGPFAFATFDPTGNTITIGRDPLGRKTIYYYEADGEFWFSSDLPALLSIRGVPRRPNPETLYVYLRHGSWNTHDQTLFADLHQLPPGSIFELDIDSPGRRALKRTRVFEIPEIIPCGFEEAVTSTRAAWLNAVEHSVSHTQGPLGASLSGGTDSSAIVAAMRHVTSPNREIHTFSFITPGYERINEEQWIDIASHAAATISHKITVSSNEFVRDLPEVTSEFGEPLIGVSQYLQYRINQLPAELGIKSMIDGVLGDSVTGGQSYFVFDRLRRAISDRKIGTAISLSQTILRQISNSPSRAYYVQALAQLPDPIHRLIRALVRLEAMPRWITNDWFAERGVSATLPDAMKGKTPMQSHIVATSLTARAIRGAERTASINTLNSHMPFLNTDFVEHMLKLPESFNFGNDGSQRKAFIAAMGSLVPSEILNRTDKVGFNAPDNVWLSEQRDWVNDLFGLARERGLPFNITSVPDDIAEQNVNRADLIRCVALAAWAEAYDVTF